MSSRMDGLHFPAYKNRDEKRLRSAVRTVNITRHLVQDVWKTPSFQREVNVTPKLRKVADEFKNSGHISTTIVIAKWDDSGCLYKLDGNRSPASKYGTPMPPSEVPPGKL